MCVWGSSFGNTASVGPPGQNLWNVFERFLITFIVRFNHPDPFTFPTPRFINRFICRLYLPATLRHLPPLLVLADTHIMSSWQLPSDTTWSTHTKHLKSYQIVGPVSCPGNKPNKFHQHNWTECVNPPWMQRTFSTDHQRFHAQRCC